MSTDNVTNLEFASATFNLDELIKNSHEIRDPWFTIGPQQPSIDVDAIAWGKLRAPGADSTAPGPEISDQPDQTDAVESKLKTMELRYSRLSSTMRSYMLSQQYAQQLRGAWWQDEDDSDQALFGLF